MKKRNFNDLDLPWQIEIAFTVIGLFFIPVPRLILPIVFKLAMNDLPLPIANLLKVDQIGAEFFPWMWLLGVILGWKIRNGIRRWLMLRLVSVL